MVRGEAWYTNSTSRSLTSNKREIVNKADLTRRLSDLSGLNMIQSKKAIAAMIDLIKEAYFNDEEISLMGLGKFYGKDVDARVFCVPMEDRKVTSSPRKVLKFKCSKTLYVRR